MNAFRESDWKLLRELKPVALERLCARILHQVAQQCDWEGRPYHQRFLRAHSLIKKGNDGIARAFDDLRRSTAFMRLFAMKTQGLITDDEFSRFSVGLRSKIQTVENKKTSMRTHRTR